MTRIIQCGRCRSFIVRVSEEDYDYLMGMGHWLITHPKGGTKQYAYQHAKHHGKTVLTWMHKVVLWRSVGPPPTPAHIIGDHWAGNTFDNRRHMLRWATHQMNSANKFGFHHKQMELPI